MNLNLKIDKIKAVLYAIQREGGEIPRNQTENEFMA
jgi:hypothetical protein